MDSPWFISCFSRVASQNALWQLCNTPECLAAPQGALVCNISATHQKAAHNPLVGHDPQCGNPWYCPCHVSSYLSWSLSDRDLRGVIISQMFSVSYTVYYPIIVTWMEQEGWWWWGATGGKMFCCFIPFPIVPWRVIPIYAIFGIGHGIKPIRVSTLNL